MPNLHSDYAQLGRLAHRMASNPWESSTHLASKVESRQTYEILERRHPGVDHRMRATLLAGLPHELPMEMRALGATARAFVDEASFGTLLQTALAESVPLLQVATVVTTSHGGEYHQGFVSSYSFSSGAVVADGDALSTPGPVFGSATSTTTWKFPAFEYVSNEMLADSSVDFESLWATTFAAQLRAYLNVQLWAGDGTTEPQGLLAGVSTGVTAGSATVLTIDDIGAALAALPEPYLRNASILVSPEAWADLTRQTLGTGSAGGQAWDASRPVDRLHGKPVYVEPELGDTATGVVAAIVGDFRQAYMVRFAPSRLDLDVNAKSSTDQAGVRLTVRADGRRLNCANALRKITMA